MKKNKVFFTHEIPNKADYNYCAKKKIKAINLLKKYIIFIGNNFQIIMRALSSNLIEILLKQNQMISTPVMFCSKITYKVLDNLSLKAINLL